MMAFNAILRQRSLKFVFVIQRVNSRAFTSQFSKGSKGLVLGVYKDTEGKAVLTSTAQHFNTTVNGQLLKLLTSCGPVPGVGKARLLLGLPGEFNAVAVTGLGSQGRGHNELEELHEGLEDVRNAAAAGCKALAEVEVSAVHIECLGNAQATAEGATLGSWQYQGPGLRAAKKRAPPQLILHGSDDIAGWESGVVRASAQNFARRLMDTPANLMTPTIFAKEAAERLGTQGVEVKIHDREWAEKLKMGSFLSVTRGTAEPPRFLEILYRGTDSKQAPVALVGKGVTFDSGGISLKPSSKMDAMRADMGGAACVVATILASAQLKLPININGYVPLCENMPGSRATKPGDVVTAMNGKTITVDNTDAEGRLILADALCLAAQANPRLTVDIATLTGAMVVSLGGAAAGAFTNCSQTWDQLRRAGAITGDRAWRFPLWSYYTRQISGSDFSGADVNNVGKPGGGGGSCTAAAFLKEFAGPGPWLHLDIASVMSADGKEPGYLPRGMAGRPVRGLVQLLSQLTL